MRREDIRIPGIHTSDVYCRKNEFNRQFSFPDHVIMSSAGL